jgi:PiT family inorganic phosphate transporter
LVSFFHGQNDGQKGVGLVMMILIAIMPAYFSLDQSINLQSISANVSVIEKIISTTDTAQFGKDEFKNFYDVKKHAAHCIASRKQD